MLLKMFTLKDLKLFKKPRYNVNIMKYPESFLSKILEKSVFCLNNYRSQRVYLYVEISVFAYLENKGFGA
jgi:hypothetical protein